MSYIYYPIASFKAEIWDKVEKSVSKQPGSIALHKSFSQGKYGTQFCLFVQILANQMQVGRCYSSQMPSSRLKCGKKLRNICPQVGLSAQLCTSHCYRQNTKSIACKFWVFVLANQMHAFKTKILGTLWPLFASYMPSLRLYFGTKQRNMSSSSLAA